MVDQFSRRPCRGRSLPAPRFIPPRRSCCRGEGFLRTDINILCPSFPPAASFRGRAGHDVSVSVRCLLPRRGFSFVGTSIDCVLLALAAASFRGRAGHHVSVSVRFACRRSGVTRRCERRLRCGPAGASLGSTIVGWRGRAGARRSWGGAGDVAAARSCRGLMGERMLPRRGRHAAASGVYGWEGRDR